MIIISNWYYACVQVLRGYFGTVDYDFTNFGWVDIPRFRLPPVYMQTTTRLFITTPGTILKNHHGYEFYVDKGLYRPDLKNYKHIFEDHYYNELWDRGFAKLSLHLNSFIPSPDVWNGDTLLNLTQNVYNFLALEKGL